MNRRTKIILGSIGGGLLAFLIFGYIVYDQFRIDVPKGHFAVLTRKTGKDIPNGQSVAPDGDHKGLQVQILTEGRHFYNPYDWDWEVYPMIDIPAGKMGVRTRLYGEELPYGDFLALKESQKGVIPEVLRPGRYAINAIVKGEKEKERKKQDYVEMIEICDPVVVAAGFRGVVTNLAGPLAENPNVVIVNPGERGVQKETLQEGTYYLNPYLNRVNIIDCRSQRFNLSEGYDMGFPSRDGFWVSLDGIIEFRVNPDKAAEVFTLYNEEENDTGTESGIHEEIVKKIIMPNARSFCRLRGSDKSGRDFIGGDTRTEFQKDFQSSMHTYCDKQGIEIVQALITKINPPQAIAEPVRQREVARQKLLQYNEQIAQQKAEADLAIEKALIEQRQQLVQADQAVIQKVTLANQQQKVDVTKSSEQKGIAERNLAAAKDKAAATISRKKAEAGIIDLQNDADAAGWQKAVEALGSGEAFAKFVLYQKLAPAYRAIMSNTADGPFMEVFRNMNSAPKK